MSKFCFVDFEYFNTTESIVNPVCVSWVTYDYDGHKFNIINREHETVSYQIEVAVDGVKRNEVGPVTLDHDDEWETVVGFTPAGVGDSQKVEFLLYRQGREEVYQELHLWVDVW